jgi:hypothetical protein
VDATKEKGYFAENTLAGSRMRTSIADLGAAISVVTKQQMEDTASLDANDIFRYEVNTEGASTYTPIVASGRATTGYADNIAGGSFGGNDTILSNASANRMRGLSAPAVGINYYISDVPVPFDFYNTTSVEINRGPNSFLFGMGKPSGIVNQSTASAEINKNSAQAQIRIDDRGSERASLSFNKTLVADKLAIYGALLYNNQQFERKPSYDITRRQYGAITYKPFKHTTLRASIEGYNNDNRRPNSMTPRDFVSEWLAAGKPSYDPRTSTYRKGDGTIIPYTTSAGSPNAEAVVSFVTGYIAANSGQFDAGKLVVNRNAGTGALTGVSYDGIDLLTVNAITNVNSPMYIRGIQPWQPRPFQMIDGNTSVGFYEAGAERVIPNWGTPLPAGAPSEAEIWANSAWAAAYTAQYSRSIGATDATLQAYKDPGVSNSSIYDWSSINTLQMNFGTARNTNYNIELEHEILPGLLHFSAGWFRQDYDSVNNYTVAQLDSATLYVDTNAYLPNGEENPYFGKIFLEDIDPDTWSKSVTSDHYRAMLAFTPDFTRNNNWTRWLGRHNILGFASRQKTTSTTVRERLMFTAAAANAELRYLPNPGYRNGAWSYVDGHNTRSNRSEDGRSVERLYYLSSPGDPDGRATHSAGSWGGATSYTGDIIGYDYATSSYIPYNMSLGLAAHSATTKRSQRKLDSYAVGTTSYFWEDRIVATLGIRHDKNKTRDSTNAGMTDAEKWINGRYQVGAALKDFSDWTELSGTTDTVGVVVKPFTGWAAIEKRAGAGSLFWEFVRDFGFSYNRSNVFDAPAGNYIDFFGTPLPKSQGNGKDYGVQFSLFKDKLFARLSWFTATSENAAANPGAAMTRLQERTDLGSFRAWAERIVLLNKSTEDPRNVSATDWANNARALFATTEEFESAVAAVWGLPYRYYTETLRGTVYGTQDQEAKGVEAQVTYNPLPNWTMRLTAGKQKSTYNNVLKEFYAWYNHRNQLWENIRAADYLNADKQQYAHYTPFESTTQVVLDDFWNSSGYIPEYGPGNTLGYMTARDYYNAVVAPEVALATDLQGQMSPGQREYRAAFVTNYNFTRGALKGFAVGGGQRWESKAIIGYYGKASGVNGDKLDLSDTTRPIYDSGNFYTDLWISYTRKIFNGKARMKLQLNVVDVFEGGGLQTVKVNYKNEPEAFRIVDPRQFILTATFDF